LVGPGEDRSTLRLAAAASSRPKETVLSYGRRLDQNRTQRRGAVAGGTIHCASLTSRSAASATDDVVKLTILSHDLSSNAAMRAHRLATAAATFAAVELIGPLNLRDLAGVAKRVLDSSSLQDTFPSVHGINPYTIRQWRQKIEARPFEILEWREERSAFAETLLDEYPQVTEMMREGVERRDLIHERLKMWLRRR
jgi:hypothetical protein